MAEEVKMPQMGESIAEGTIVRWLKQVGEQVKRDEPLFEISTDKVDAEIPSSISGTLTEIKVQEGETVPVGTVVAVIGDGAAQPAAVADSKADDSAKPVAAAPPPAETVATPTPAPTLQADGQSTAPAANVPATAPAAP